MTEDQPYPLLVKRDENLELVIGTHQKDYVFDTYYMHIRHEGYKPSPEKYNGQLTDPERLVNFSVTWKKSKGAKRYTFNFNGGVDTAYYWRLCYDHAVHTDDIDDDVNLLYPLRGYFSLPFINIII